MIKGFSLDIRVLHTGSQGDRRQESQSIFFCIIQDRLCVGQKCFERVGACAVLMEQDIVMFGIALKVVEPLGVL